MIDFDQMIKNQCTISPENQNGGKLMNLVFDSDKVEKLLKKCKADNLKLTGAINLLMVLAVVVKSPLLILAPCCKVSESRTQETCS
jgi:hypothetical protein